MKKRRFWLIVTAIVAAEVLAAVVWRCCLFPEREVSDLYQRYCHVPGIEASYVKGFRINDTLAIDATLLHATDSASWERLVEDFGLMESVRVIPDKPSIIVRRVSKENPYQRVHAPNEPFYNLVAVPDRREIHLYCTENEQQRMDLHMHLLLKYMTTSKTQNIKKQ